MYSTNDEIRLAGSTLGRSRHVCAFFNSREEEQNILLPFIKDGIQRGDKVFHIIDPQVRQEYLCSLEQAELPTSELEIAGQLEVCGWDKAYLRGGHFDQDAMIALLEEVLQTSKAQGYPMTRIMGSVEWAAEDRPLLNDVLEYETRLNYALPKYDDVVLCIYDLAKFDAGVVMDILRTHPMVVIGGVLHENVFFVPPDEFLRELRARESASARC